MCNVGVIVGETTSLKKRKKKGGKVGRLRKSRGGDNKSSESRKEKVRRGESRGSRLDNTPAENQRTSERKGGRKKSLRPEKWLDRLAQKRGRKSNREEKKVYEETDANADL